MTYEWRQVAQAAPEEIEAFRGAVARYGGRSRTFDWAVSSLRLTSEDGKHDFLCWTVGQGEMWGAEFVDGHPDTGISWVSSDTARSIEEAQAALEMRIDSTLNPTPSKAPRGRRAPRKSKPATDEPIEPRYFAVLDPLDPERMLYWRRADRGRNEGQLHPWPQNRNPWPLYYRDMPDGRAKTDANTAYMEQHWARTQDARAEVKRRIEEDPGAAAALFSELNIACCCCGRPLTDERSKAYGVGPECRQGWSADELAAQADAVGHAHAEQRAGA